MEMMIEARKLLKSEQKTGVSVGMKTDDIETLEEQDIYW